MAGKVALITGSAGGLGLTFAQALLDKGAKVCISDINTEKGKAAERELQEKYSSDNVFFLRCDVTDDTEFESTVKSVIKKFDGLDILCNNAGISDEIEWRQTIAVNMSAVIHGTLLGLRYMGKAVDRFGAVIINVSSAAGIAPLPIAPVYSAVKHGVVGFTRSIGFLSPRLNDVRVNCLCPTFTDIGMTKDSLMTPSSVYKGDPQYLNVAKKIINNAGMMQPEEVAECFLQLVEDESKSGAVMWVTPKKKIMLTLPMSISDVNDKYSKL